MTGIDLPDLSAADPVRVAAARRQIHNATQWLARAANSFVPHASGNTHLRLAWDGARTALATQRFEGTLAVELRLPALHLQFLEDGRPVPHVLDLEDRTPAAVEAWLLVELLHRDKNRDGFSKALPYDIAAPMTGDSETYTPEELALELALLAAWAKAASAILTPLAGGEAFRFWPDMLQFGFVVPAEGVASNGGSHVRIAFSLGGETVAEPHFRAVPENHGTVQSLRPDAVVTASRIRGEAMSADAVRACLARAPFV